MSESQNRTPFWFMHKRCNYLWKSWFLKKRHWMLSNLWSTESEFSFELPHFPPQLLSCVSHLRECSYHYKDLWVSPSCGGIIVIPLGLPLGCNSWVHNIYLSYYFCNLLILGPEIRSSCTSRHKFHKESRLCIYRKERPPRSFWPQTYSLELYIWARSFH